MQDARKCAPGRVVLIHLSNVAPPRSERPVNPMQKSVKIDIRAWMCDEEISTACPKADATTICSKLTHSTAA
jgi:hypothetical protein